MTVRAAAAELGVHENTIRNWIHAGRLEAMAYPSGVWRPKRAAVMAIRAQQWVEREVRACPHCGGDISDQLDASFEFGYARGYEKRGEVR